MREDEGQKESARILKQVARESDVLGASSLVRAARDAGGSLLGEDQKREDGVERWARRVGRILGLGFAIYLAATLMRHFSGI